MILGSALWPCCVTLRPITFAVASGHVLPLRRGEPMLHRLPPHWTAHPLATRWHGVVHLWCGYRSAPTRQGYSHQRWPSRHHSGLCLDGPSRDAFASAPEEP
jgi:hypothetical protein